MEEVSVVLPATLGLVFVIVGLIVKRFPPKKINYFYGYRTPASMKSPEHWEFAQAYSTKELIRTGIILIILSPMGFIQFAENMGPTFGVTLSMLLVIVMIYRTEMAIRRKFRK